MYLSQNYHRFTTKGSRFTKGSCTNKDILNSKRREMLLLYISGSIDIATHTHRQKLIDLYEDYKSTKYVNECRLQLGVIQFP